MAISLPRAAALADLEARRKALGMPIESLVKRSGVSRATVRRILAGDQTRATFPNVLAVADALGIDVRFAAGAPAEEFREQQAVKKARRLVGLVQGTSGLEAQAVDPATVERMVRRTTHELLSGSKRRLWSD
jgi:transcriptional regulator with XRE-family HTH domain